MTSDHRSPDPREPREDTGGSASGVDPRTTPQESGHKHDRDHDHPQGDRSTRRPSADAHVDDDGSEKKDSNIESDSSSDEDARSRRRDLP